MGNKNPLDSAQLAKRLYRVAKFLDQQAEAAKPTDPVGYAKLRAFANTCWQVAGRLEDAPKE